MKRTLRAALLVVLFALAGCATQTPPPSPAPLPAAMPQPEHPFFRETGVASFYGGAQDGNITASGERFNQRDFTAAHRTLAFGTVVRVTNLANGRMVKVSINDRGPHVKDRIIDLSAAAAHALGMRKSGIAQVKLEAFQEDQAPG